MARLSIRASTSDDQGATPSASPRCSTSSGAKASLPSASASASARSSRRTRAHELGLTIEGGIGEGHSPARRRRGGRVVQRDRGAGEEQRMRHGRTHVRHTPHEAQPWHRHPRRLVVACSATASTAIHLLRGGLKRL